MSESKLFSKFLLLDSLKGKSILFDSESNNARNHFALSFLNEILSAGIPAIYFSFGQSQEMLKSPGLNLGKLKFIDCYSKARSYDSLSSELNDFIDSFKGPYLLAFNSLSSFLAFNSPNTLYHFLFFEHSRIKKRNAIALHCIDSCLHDSKVFGFIQKLSDVHLKGIEEEGTVKISILPSSKNFFGFKTKEFIVF
ncbi:MAG: hypothetical protein AB1467_04605 [Candidatus Diapherotrites archaeon]